MPQFEDSDQLETYIQLGAIESFVEEFEWQLQHAANQSALRTRADARAANEEPDYTVHEAYFDRLFPRFLEYSYVLLIWMICERHLRAFCNTVKAPIRRGEVKGGFLDQVKVYITKLVGWDLPKDEWEWLRDLYDVRNCIAHHAGEVSALQESDRKRLLSMTEGRHGIGVETDYANPEEPLVLAFGPDFCRQAVQAVGRLFDILYQKRRERAANE